MWNFILADEGAMDDFGGIFQRSTPMDNSHRAVLCEEVKRELEGENVSDEELRRELLDFDMSFRQGNQRNGRLPCFAMLDANGKVVGGIGLCKWTIIKLDERSHDTYNFEYYIIPAGRRKGLAKASCFAFVEALRKGSFIYEEDPLLVYGVKPKPLSVNLLNAEMYSKNEASLRAVKLLDCFDFCGNIKYMRASERENGYVLDSVSHFTCVL